MDYTKKNRVSNLSALHLNGVISIFFSCFAFPKHHAPTWQTFFVWPEKYQLITLKPSQSILFNIFIIYFIKAEVLSVTFTFDDNRICSHASNYFWVRCCQLHILAHTSPQEVMNSRTVSATLNCFYFEVMSFRPVKYIKTISGKIAFNSSVYGHL